MADVGGIACDRVSGSVKPLRETIRPYRTPGLDGIGAHKTGQGQSEFAFVIALYGLSTILETWRDEVSALQSDEITIVDERGISYENCLLVTVSEMSRTPARFPGTFAGINSPIEERGEIQVSGFTVIP